MKANKSHSTIDDYYMPPLDIKKVNNDGIENLARAVVVSVCKDYVDSVKGYARCFDMPLLRRNYEFSLRGLERWFKSDVFKLYSGGGIDPEKVIYTLKYDTPEKYLTEKEVKEGGLHIKELEDSMYNLPIYSVCDEMAKLREFLTKRGIKWVDDSIITQSFWVCVTKVKISKTVRIDILNGYCTTGGFNRFSKENAGLLQVITNGKGEDEPECVEDTAHGVYSYILDLYEGEIRKEFEK